MIVRRKRGAALLDVLHAAVALMHEDSGEPLG
jgi:hypothetical protein